MRRLVVHEQSCKSCHYCEKHCPKQAITISGPINEKGYITPVVDREKCILCGTCYNVCPDYVYEILESEEGGEA